MTLEKLVYVVVINKKNIPKEIVDLRAFFYMLNPTSGTLIIIILPNNLSENIYLNWKKHFKNK